MFMQKHTILATKIKILKISPIYQGSKLKLRVVTQFLTDFENFFTSVIRITFFNNLNGTEKNLRWGPFLSLIPPIPKTSQFHQQLHFPSGSS